MRLGCGGDDNLIAAAPFSEEDRATLAQWLKNQQ
jgi:hypothetical protein